VNDPPARGYLIEESLDRKSISNSPSTSFGADLQGFRHARLRHFSSDTQIALMGFHQQPHCHGTKCANIHGRLGVSNSMRRRRSDAVSKLLDKRLNSSASNARLI
jgi:hypothetical protein